MNYLKKNLISLPLKAFMTLGLFLGLQSVIAQEVIRVDASNSPFYILSDTTINVGDSLLVGPGGMVIIGNSVDIHVKGTLYVQGSLNEPAKLLPLNEGIGWGQLIIHESVDSLKIKNAQIVDGRIHAKHCIVYYENAVFTNHQSLIWSDAISRFFYGQLNIKNCSFNGINQGEGLLCHDIINPIITNCTFDAVPDAIEYLSCDYGRIRNCHFQNCQDDAIDLNNCFQTIIDSNFLYNISNRGMEIGSDSYGSSIAIQVNHNILVNCQEAITFKEGSTGKIVNNTFYNNNIAVNSVVLGSPVIGSSVEIINSIFHNNTQDTFVDSESELSTNYCSSNNSLFFGLGNVFGPAKFVSVLDFNFNLKLSSICINSGSPTSNFDLDGSRADMGALFQPLQGLLNDIRIWPNPASEILKIHVMTPYDELTIIDHEGRILARLNLIDLNTILYSVAELSTGIYFAVFTNSEQTKVFNFLVE